jgi:hypothetical protein
MQIQVEIAELRRELIAVYSIPRLAPTEVLLDTVKAVGKLGIRVIPRGGVFWGQALTRACQQAIDEGASAILTIDYDTPHEVEDILKLYAMLKARPDADAICALQMRRNSRETLISARGANGEMSPTLSGTMFADQLVRVAGGNFGLTIIRASSLARLPKPWFIPIPDKNGEWGDGHVDEDVNFWRKWEAAGFTLFCAQDVAVAHMEWMRTWPGRHLQPIYQSMADYEMNGKPSAVWDSGCMIRIEKDPAPSEFPEDI